MDQAKRTLNVIAVSFAGAAVVAVVVLSLVNLGEPANPDLAGGAVRAATAFGGIGLVLALLWYARSGERTTTPNRLLIGFVVRVAVAELGLLLGILGLLSTGSNLSAPVGLGFFLVSLLVLAAGLRRIG